MYVHVLKKVWTAMRSGTIVRTERWCVQGVSVQFLKLQFGFAYKKTLNTGKWCRAWVVLRWMSVIWSRNKIWDPNFLYKECFYFTFLDRNWTISCSTQYSRFLQGILWSLQELQLLSRLGCGFCFKSISAVKSSSSCAVQLKNVCRGKNQPYMFQHRVHSSPIETSKTSGAVCPEAALKILMRPSTAG